MKKRALSLVKSSNILKTISNKSLSSFLLKIGSMVVQYLTMLIIIRKFGLGVWGNFTLSFTILNMIVVFGTLGLGNYMVKTVSTLIVQNNDAAIQTNFYRSLVLTLIATVSLAGLCFLLSNKWDQIFRINDFGKLIQLVVLGAPFLGVLRVNTQVLRGYQKTDLFTLIHSNGLLYGLILVGSIFLIPSVTRFGNEQAILYLLLGSLIILTGYSFFVLSKELRLSKGIKSKATEYNYKTILNVSLPMLFASSMMYIMGWTDTLVLGHYVSSIELGSYNTLFKISSLATISLFAIGAITSPKIAATYNNGKITECKRTILQSSKATFLLTLPIVLVVSLFPDLLLSLFDKNILQYKTTLYVLILGYLISAFCGQVGNVLQMTGHEKTFRNIIIVSTISNVTLNLILIPFYGLLGAAIASTISMSLWNMASVYYVWKYFKINMIYIPLLHTPKL